ncbi:MAG: dienelactone hydrolase [Hyphomicrobiales bacterium]|nr:MAG: dienelactone hydrolase [Hyphomicrobiales bacterium]
MILDRRTALWGLAGTLATAGPTIAATSVTIDRSDGAGSGRRPAVLLLHGADGITRSSQYQFAAAALSAQGYTVLFPHYFEITGERRASYSEIGTKYPRWLGGLRMVVDEVLADPAIDPARFGVVGVSLGGALALSLAAHDQRIKAVISYFGFRPGDLDAGSPQAPTLILHGDADRVVPVRNAAQIEATLRARGVPVEKHIYPGEGHGLSGAAQLDAATRTADFLRRQLGH